jgi:hypothetical protein
MPQTLQALQEAALMQLEMKAPSLGLQSSSKTTVNSSSKKGGRRRDNLSSRKETTLERPTATWATHTRPYGSDGAGRSNASLGVDVLAPDASASIVMEM